MVWIWMGGGVGGVKTTIRVHYIKHNSVVNKRKKTKEKDVKDLVSESYFVIWTNNYETLGTKLNVMIQNQCVCNVRMTKDRTVIISFNCQLAMI